MTETMEDKTSKVLTLKKRISEELDVIDKDIKNMEKSKKESVEKIEIKKVELKKFSNTQDICDEHYATLQEIEQATKLIDERKDSITALDSTIANLDLQIAKIQSEHDKAVAELERKRRRLNDYLKYYEDLNDKLEKLIDLLGEEERKHCLELNNLKSERAKSLARTDLSENALNKVLGELDKKMEDLNKEHGKLIDSISQKLSEITVDAGEVEELLSEGQKKPGQEKPKMGVLRMSLTPDLPDDLPAGLPGVKKKKKPKLTKGKGKDDDGEAVEGVEGVEAVETEEAEEESEPTSATESESQKKTAAIEKEKEKKRKEAKHKDDTDSRTYSVLEPVPADKPDKEKRAKQLSPKSKPKTKTDDEDAEPAETKLDEIEDEEKEILYIKGEPLEEDYGDYDSDETDIQHKKAKKKKITEKRT